MKLFLDTNVLLDLLDASRQPFHLSAEKIFEHIALGSAQGIIATSQVTDLYYMLRKAASDEEVRRKLSLLFGLCELYPTPVLACNMALRSVIHDFEDAVQAETARAACCDFIVTRNLNDYCESPVPVIDPAELAVRLGDTLNG